jgi:serine/threonine-protein kinase OSR1/STK39
MEERPSRVDPIKLEWPTNESGYTLKNVIGSGAFATVYKADCPSMGTQVAIKVIDLEAGGTSLDDIRAEVATMRLCNHPNVLPCYATFAVKSTLWVVTPLMGKGSCLHIMRELKRTHQTEEGEGLKEEWIWTIINEVVKGLEYLHKAGWIHRDIKAGNILIDDEGRVMIADFGVAGLLQGNSMARGGEVCKTFVGTPCWMAPEVMEQAKGYTEKADIWSLGITALELAKGYAPYAREKPVRVLLRTIKEDPPSLKTYPEKNDFSRGFRNLVAALLLKKANQRPSTTKILERFKSNFKKSSIEGLKTELLPLIPSLGDKDVAPAANLPGTGPLFLEIAADTEAETSSEDKSYAKGTTWNFSGISFDDGDLKTKLGTSVERLIEVKEVIGETADDDVLSEINMIGEHGGI